MAHVVILGAGIGGLPMAYELRDMLGKSHRISVISNRSKFHFVPSNPWVAVNWRQRQEVEFDPAPTLARKGIAFSDVGAQRVRPECNQVLLGDGSTLDYDFLIIATGPEHAYDEIDGLGPMGYTQAICHPDHAELAGQAWEKFVQAPGPIIVGAAPGVSCFGPAYEFAFIMETDLRRRKIRDRVPMTFVTSEPYIGHLGLGGVGDSRGMFESMMRERHIRWLCNARVLRITDGAMQVAECNETGATMREHDLPFAYAMMLPAFRGVAAVAGIEGLTNPRGFVLVDEYQRNPSFPNVFAVGTCVAIPPVEATPVPLGTPKTGYMIESMVTATAHNIGAILDGKAPHARATWNAVCLADCGDTGIAIVALPQIPPRNVSWFSHGKWVHLAKVLFERYFMKKMKTGHSEPIFEKHLFKLLGILKLKDS